MPKLPEPPPVTRLREVGPAFELLPAGTLLWRVHFRGGVRPSRWNQLRHFGPTDARFDHQLPPPRVQLRAILYAARSGPTCLAEVFQAARTIDRHRDDPWLAAFELTRELRLLDATGSWPTRAGASMALGSGPRARARRWSQAIYAAFPAAEGIAYASSMNANRPAFALYERARSALPRAPAFHRALADPALQPALDSAAQTFGYVVV
ncbi:MAG: RES family NAD+ phosphorylase [Myxococcales bacterium]